MFPALAPPSLPPLIRNSHLNILSTKIFIAVAQILMVQYHYYEKDGQKKNQELTKRFE